MRNLLYYPRWAYVQVREVNVATNKNRNPINVRNQCWGEPYVRPLTETEIQPMSETNVGANLVFAL